MKFEKNWGLVCTSSSLLKKKRISDSNVRYFASTWNLYYVLLVNVCNKLMKIILYYQIDIKTNQIKISLFIIRNTTSNHVRCLFNLTGFNNTIDCPYIVEDKFSKIFENNAIFDIYRDGLDETENKYYYALIVRVPPVVMLTVVVENEVEIQFEIQIEMLLLLLLMLLLLLEYHQSHNIELPAEQSPSLIFH